MERRHPVSKRGLFVVLAVLVSLLIFVDVVPAQQSFQCALNAHGAFPEGEFKDNVSNAGAGVGLDFIYTPASSPFGVGASFGYLIYGHEQHRETVRTNTADFDVDVETNNSIILGHLLLRVQRKLGALRPYLDGLIGVSHLRTDSQMEDPDWYDEEEIGTTHIHDTVFSYGGGVGFMIKILAKQRKNRWWTLYTDFGVRYISGGKAEYLKKGGISRVDGSLVYDLKTSRTDLITAQVGISVDF